MKKPFAILTASVACLLAGATLLTACGETPDDNPPADVVIEGTYKFYSITAEGTEYKVGQFMPGETSSVLHVDIMTLTLGENEFAFTMSGNTMTGTWSENANDKNKIDLVPSREGASTMTVGVSESGISVNTGMGVALLKKVADDASAPIAIVGTYKFYSFTKEGVTRYVGENRFDNEAEQYGLNWSTIELKSDGTFTLTQAGEPTDGTWVTVNEAAGALTLTANTYPVNAVAGGGYLTMPFGPDTIVYIKA